MSKRLGFYISKGLRKYLNPPAIRDSVLHSTVKIWDHSTVTACKIDKYTYVSSNTVVSYCDIGAFCSISSYCQIGGASHPMMYVSTSPVFVLGHNAFGYNLAEHAYEPYKKTIIGNDVWIGTHCAIRSGVNINDGAIIGMGSVVTKDIGPYEIWAGNPARFIRKRFDDEIIEKLLQTKWWEKSDKEIVKFAKVMNDPELLIKELGIE